jgi:hypothetical protein
MTRRENKGVQNITAINSLESIVRCVDVVFLGSKAM